MNINPDRDQLINPLLSGIGWIALYPDGALVNLPDYQMELVPLVPDTPAPEEEPILPVN